jgi:hypothetical protein
MVSFHVVRRLLAACVLLPLAASASADPAAKPAPAASSQPSLDTDKLTLTGTVQLADGKPAAGAVIELLGLEPQQTIASDAGEFHLTGGFEGGIPICARTPDGSQQVIFTLSPLEVRTTVRSPQTINLVPAQASTVQVTLNGVPVPDAQIAMSGAEFVSTASTDSGGQAKLRFPANAMILGVAAWHPTLGVCGVTARGGGPAQESYQLELLPPAPHEVRVVDENGQPIAGLEFGVDVATGDFSFIHTAPIADARVRTDADGIAKFAWAPRDNLRYVNALFWSKDFKADRIDANRIKEGITTMRLRRKQPVNGRLVVPAGVDPANILITGWGVGAASLDIPYARVRRDGTFTLRVAPGHGYVVGVLDTQWAAEPWVGEMKTDTAAPTSSIEMKLYPAAPVKVRVSRGADRMPVEGAFLHLGTERPFTFTSDSGEKNNAIGTIGWWAKTDHDGIVRGAAGIGGFKVRFSSGDWTDERVIDVKSADPIAVDFHRAWLGKRRFVGSWIDQGQQSVPSPEAKLLAWTARSQSQPLEHAPKFTPDGWELEFDADTASLLFFDPTLKRSVKVDIGPEDTNANLVLQPTATYAGTLVDSVQNTLADRAIYLCPEGQFSNAIVKQRTDSAGHFRFEAVPSQTALVVRVRADATSEQRNLYVPSGERYFEPGEVRDNEVVEVRGVANSAAGPARLTIPLQESLKTICRDARLSPMRAIVFVAGDQSDNVGKLSKTLLDHDQTPDVLAYRVFEVSPSQHKNEAGLLAGLNWPAPADGELLLLVLDENLTVAQHARLAAADLEAAVAAGQKFLHEQKPPQRDAKDLLAAARQEAKASGRRVWVVSGGPRCGPCFRLSRWMDDHHAVLDKDFVILKVMGGLDEHAADVTKELPGAANSGIPFHAITEPDGKVLITSTGPLGNIGMPLGEVEGVRHLRKMLEQTATWITPEEIAALEKSLLQQP